MVDVLEDPSARLYAGALLGKALSKQLGTDAAEQSGESATATRTATLEAGVASGKIDPKTLSPGDAGLLGTALSGKTKIPSIGSDPVGKFFGNLAKGGGEFLESLPHVPSALITTGKNFGEEVGKTVVGDKGNKSAPFMEELGLVGKGIAHDFSSPRQLYEHPFNPILDVAGAASGGAGLAAKFSGGLAEGLGAADTSRLALAAKRVAGIGSELGREDAIVSPGLPGALHDVSESRVPRLYSPNLGYKYTVQKPLDKLFSSRLSRKQLANGETLSDILQGKYWGKKVASTINSQLTSGTAEGLEHSPLPGFLNSVDRMFKGNKARGHMMFEATLLHKSGIDDLDKLDQYAEKIREGEDLDGVIMTPEMQEAAQWKLELFQNPEFRQLIEEPKDIMKEVSHQIDRLNVHHAYLADIDPTVSEDSAYGRLRALTGKTNDELKADEKPTLRLESKFAKGLQTLQEHIEKEPSAEPPVNLKELALHIPYGTMAQKVSILERAVHSLLEDREGANAMDHRGDPDYLQGRTIYSKVAAALHDELGVDETSAEAFARGVPYGSPEGSILKSYVPSVSGRGKKFGELPENKLRVIGRNLGVGRFRSLDEDYRYKAFYDIRTSAKPSAASRMTIARDPSKNFLKDATYASFQKGVADLSPAMIARNAHEIQRQILEGKLNDKMIDKMGLKTADGLKAKIYNNEGELEQDIGLAAKHYTLVPVRAIRAYVASKAQLEGNAASLIEKGEDTQAQLEALADESARQLMDGVTHDTALNIPQNVALPTYFVTELIRHARVAEEATSIGKAITWLTGRWKAATLSYSPAWLLRTTVGHGLVAIIDGVVDPRYYKLAHTYFQDKTWTVDDLKSVDWGKSAGDQVLGGHGLPLGVNQGSIMHELGTTGEIGREAKLALPARKISETVHTITNWQRRAITLRNFDRAAKTRLAELGKSFDHPGGFWNTKNIDAVLNPQWVNDVLQHPRLFEAVKDQLSQVSYTFGEMTAFERRLIKYGMPFYGWYKFISKFVWSMPVNYPGRADMIEQLGHIGEDEIKNLGPLPPYLSGALWFDHGDLERARYINIYGLNPLSDVANPLGKEGFAQGIARIGQLGPLTQAAIAGAMGINPVTGEAEAIAPEGFETERFGNIIDLNTGEEKNNAGQVHPLMRFLGTLMRAFPEVRALDLLKNKGNPVYGESIPFIDDKLKGVNPVSRRGFNLGGFLEGEFGAQRRIYNASKNAAESLKKLDEARKRNVKTKARDEQRLALPTP